MNNLPKLFISIGDLEISLIVGHDNDESSFELLEKLIFPIEGVSENRIVDVIVLNNYSGGISQRSVQSEDFENIEFEQQTSLKMAVNRDVLNRRETLKSIKIT